MTHHEEPVKDVKKTCDCDPATCTCTDETCTCPPGECKCDHKAHGGADATEETEEGKPSACDGEIPAVPEGADLTSPEGSGPETIV